MREPQHTLIVIRQRSRSQEWGDRDVIREHYIRAKAEINKGPQKVPYSKEKDHTVAVFRIGDNGDLLEAHCILGSM